MSEFNALLLKDITIVCDRLENESSKSNADLQEQSLVNNLLDTDLHTSQLTPTQIERMKKFGLC